MRGIDWSATPLGVPSGWSAALQTLVAVMLGSHQPMFVAWGPDRIMLYNDSYAQICGSRHPASLGSRFDVVWHDIMDEIGPILDRAYAGEPTYSDDIQLTMHRHGYAEETHFAFSYTPVRDPDGTVAGMFCACTETTRQVQAQRRLAGERERQRLLLQQMPGFVALLAGPSHVYDYVNDAYVAIAGRRDFIGRPIREVFSELRTPGHFDELDRVFASGQPFVARALPIRLAADGAERFVDLIYQPIRDEADAVVGIFVGGYDVTDRVRADATLRHAQRRQGFLLALNDTLRRQGDPRAAMQAAVDAIGRHLALSRVGYGLIDTDGRQVTLETEYVDHVVPLAATYPLDAFGAGQIARLRSGRIAAYADVEASPDTAGLGLGALGIAASLGVPLVRAGRLHAVLYLHHRVPRAWTHSEIELVEDVAARIWDAVERARAQDELERMNQTLEAQVDERSNQLREALAALEISTKRLRTAFETSFVLQGYLEPDGTLLDVNPAALAAIEGRLETVVGQPFWDTPWFSATPGVPAMVQDAVRRAAAGETSFGAFVVNLPTGRRAFDFSLRPVRTLTGAVIGLISEAFETTQRLAAEEQLRQSQKMEAVGQLTGGLAHDFNNLLTGITGSLELLRARIAQGRHGETERFIAAAMRAADRAAALTHRLLAFSRRQTLDPKPTDVNRLVADMEELVRRTVGPSVTLDTVAAEGLWNTLVDPPQLENALLNLCLNARDAMPEGGRLTIQTANCVVDRRTARERELSAGDYVMLRVTDTGTGMSAEVSARAFDPFFTTKPIGMGTGLGLSMIYGFARQSGGQVRIASSPGQGTTVSLYLPRHRGKASDEAASDATAPSQAPRAVDGETVLVVDDEPTVRMLVADVLLELGYRALEAEDGAGALRILESGARIDLLVSDVGLPNGMNGRQVADAARMLRPGLKVLFITGYAETAVIGDGQLEPGMHLLTKPFTMKTLAGRIRALIEGA